MNTLQGIDEFVQTVNSRSFVAAATVLGMTPSGVSKAVHRLEKRLGVRLLHRTTRSLSLTSEGDRFLLRCKSLLTEFQEARDELSAAGHAVVGRVRLELPTSLGALVIAPKLHTLTARYPQLQLDVTFSERLTDLTAEGIDVAVRLGNLADSGLIARTAGSFSIITCAAPHYLKNAAELLRPIDLMQHPCLGFFFPQTGRTLDWVFQKNDHSERITPNTALRFNNGEAILLAAVAGAGVAHLPSFIARAAIANGLLVTVLSDWRSAGAPISVVTAMRQSRSGKVQVVAQAMLEFLADVN